MDPRSFVLGLELIVLKEDSIAWNKGVFENVVAHKAYVLDQTNYWDENEREWLLSLEDSKAKRVALEKSKLLGL